MKDFKTLFISGILILLLVVNLSAQVPDTMWTKTYGGSYDDGGESVQQTTDGGYIITGWTESYGAGANDVYLIKTDGSGEEEWYKTYGGSDGDGGYSVQQTTDGGYIIGGYTRSGVDPDRIYLIKTDSLGNLEWEKTYGGNPNARAYSAKQTPDDGYIIGGWTGYNHPGWHVDYYLIRTDSNGDTLWTEKYGENVYGQNYGRSLQITNDNGYIIAGDAAVGAASRRVWVIKTEPEQIGVEDKQDLRSKIIDLRLLCYPNPFTTELSIMCSGLKVGQKVVLDIYDMSGRLVKSLPLTTNRLSLGTDLKPGIYFLKVDGKSIGKVVKVG